MSDLGNAPRSANVTLCVPCGSFWSCASENPLSLLFTQIWKYWLPVLPSSHTRNKSATITRNELLVSGRVRDRTHQQDSPHSDRPQHCYADSTACIVRRLSLGPSCNHPPPIVTFTYTCPRQKRTTHKLNTSPGADAFHTFRHTLNVSGSDGVAPKRSIRRSPVVSIGMGWMIAEGGAATGWRSICPRGRQSQGVKHTASEVYKD